MSQRLVAPTASGTAAAAAGAAAAAAAAVVGVNHVGLALTFVREHRKDPEVIALGNEWISVATRAQLFVLQQQGNTANCAVCGDGVSAAARKCTSCRRLAHRYCDDAQLCALCRNPYVGDELERTLRRTVHTSEWEQASARIDLFLPIPPRRRIRIMDAQGKVTAAAATFRRAVKVLLNMEGDMAAELLLLYLPRVAAPKGLSPAEGLDAWIRNVPPQPRDRRPLPPATMWRHSVESALEAGRTRTLHERLLSGPEGASPFDANAHAKEYFPALDGTDGEAERWDHIVRRATADGRFSPRELARWAHSSPSSSGGELGWTGHMVLVLRGDKDLFAQFARWAARPPDKWAARANWNIAARTLTGWFIPSGEKVRPISAPSFIRRVGSRVMMRKARPLAERFCRQRGQLGLSNDQYQLAYSALPQAMVKSGGTAALDDRSKSFVHIFRRAVHAAFVELLATATEDDEEAITALATAVNDYYVTGVDHVSMVNFEQLQEMQQVQGLAQGCSTSPTIEAIVLAHFSGQALPSSAESPLILGNHDDLMRCAPQGLLPTHVPSCATVGGSYNSAKSKAIGIKAEAMVQAGLSAHVCETASIWGRPLGDTQRWMEHKLAETQRKMGSLRTLLQESPAAAIRAAVRIGGPQGFLCHALRGTPPDDYDPKWVQSLEQDWADLVVDMCGHRSEEWNDPIHRVTRVFADDSIFRRPAATAERHCLAGLSVARAGVTALLGMQAAETVTRALAGRYLAERNIPLTTQDIGQHLERCAKEATSFTPTLWHLALAGSTDLTQAIDVTRRRTAITADEDIADLTARLALAHTIGFPVKTVVGLQRHSCPRCGPDKTIDDRLHHMQTCKRSEMGRRHNELAKLLVGVARATGTDVEEHDATLPCLPDGSRPADFIERQGLARPDICIDLTVTLPAQLGPRVLAKHKKYDPLLEPVKNRFRFTTFAVSLDGVLHQETEATITRWRDNYANLRGACGLDKGCSDHFVRVEVAAVFARSHAAAVSRWRDHIVGLTDRARRPVPVPLPTGPRKRSRPRQPVAGAPPRQEPSVPPAAPRRGAQDQWDQNHQQGDLSNRPHTTLVGSAVSAHAVPALARPHAGTQLAELGGRVDSFSHNSAPFGGGVETPATNDIRKNALVFSPEADMALGGSRAGIPTANDVGQIVTEPYPGTDRSSVDNQSIPLADRLGAIDGWISATNNAVVPQTTECSYPNFTAAQLKALSNNSGIIPQRMTSSPGGVGNPGTYYTGSSVSTSNQGPGMEIGDDRATRFVNRLGNIGGHNASTDADPTAH
jgi:hypothetical protein